MADVTIELLKAHLRQLRLPTMSREFETLTRDAAATNQSFAQLLLRLTEAELSSRAANAVNTRIKNAGFPVEKDFDTYDFSVMPNLSKPKILELGAGRLDRPEIQLLPGGEPWDGEDPYLGRAWPGGLSCGPAGAFLHGGGAGEPTGGGAEAVHAGSVPGPVGEGPPADLRRAGVRVDEPGRGWSCCSASSPTGTSGAACW